MGAVQSALLVLLLAMASCHSTVDNTDGTTDSDTMPHAWTVTYADHSGNTYRFWKTAEGAARFAYDPVTPAMSSSGTYSGGEPREGALEPAQAETLLERVRDLEAQTGIHAGSRMMGTGLFRLREGGGETRRFVVGRGAALRSFHDFVVPYREPPTEGSRTGDG